MKKIIKLVILISLTILVGGCEGRYRGDDIKNQLEVASKLEKAQGTPTDIDYSLERYNLIKRSYWVNGQREKAINLPTPMSLPLGNIILFSANTIIGQFNVEGKVSSLNSMLTPPSEKYSSSYVSEWLSDVDGSYGVNDGGIFFFTTDGKYVEWNGGYLYSDLPMFVDNPTVKIKEAIDEQR